MKVGSVKVLKESQKTMIISMGAAFMGAMVSVGPALITQISNFTYEYKGAIGVVLCLVIIMTFVAQISIWRITAGSNQYIQDIANNMHKGLGSAIALMIAVCGFIFNIGNIAGASVGIHYLINWNNSACIILSMAVAIGLYASNNSKKILNIVAQISGFVFILILLYTVLQHGIPFKNITSDYSGIVNKQDLCYPALSLIGTGLGGFVMFIGAHSLIDEHRAGVNNIHEIEKTSIIGVTASAVMRVLLFFAVYAVVSQGIQIDSDNTLLSVFNASLPAVGTILFGAIMTISSLSCIVICTYASTEFFQSAFHMSQKHIKRNRILFVVLTGSIALLYGKPVKLLMIVGAIVGLTIPLIILIPIVLVCKYKNILGEKYPFSKVRLVLLIICFAIITIICIGSLPSIWHMIVS